jgi:hypothetical protein
VAKQEFYESYNQHYLKMIVFDIGANVGSFARDVIDCSFSQLHLFEPSESNYILLQEQFGSLEQIIINKVGTGEKVEQVTLWSDWIGTGASTFFNKVLRCWQMISTPCFRSKLILAQ